MIPDGEKRTLANLMEKHGVTKSPLFMLASSRIKSKAPSSNEEEILKAIPEWIQSRVLENVRQIGIELHTGKVYFDRKGQTDAAKKLLKFTTELYDLGFRHISYSPNTCVGKSQDPNGQYYTFIDIVLYKPYTSDQ